MAQRDAVRAELAAAGRELDLTVVGIGSVDTAPAPLINRSGRSYGDRADLLITQGAAGSERAGRGRSGVAALRGIPRRVGPPDRHTPAET